MLKRHKSTSRKSLNVFLYFLSSRTVTVNERVGVCSCRVYEWLWVWWILRPWVRSTSPPPDVKKPKQCYRSWEWRVVFRISVLPNKKKNINKSSKWNFSRIVLLWNIKLDTSYLSKHLPQTVISENLCQALDIFFKLTH